MKRRNTIILLGIVATAGAIAAGWWASRPVQIYTDGAAISRPTGADSPRQVLWDPPLRVDTLSGIAMEVYEPRTSWDGRTLYFVGGKTGANADIYSADRTPTGWSEPKPLDGVNSEHDDLGPQPSPDGSALYFYSDRFGGSGGYDLWVARRSDDDPTRWLEATNLGPAVNSEWNDYGPAVSPDGSRLLFSSNRPRPGDSRQPDPHAWSATVRESFFNRPYDLYSASITSAGVQGPLPVERLNSPASEGAACFSPAGDFVYFASDRSGGRGGFDLYRSRLLRGEFLAPENIGDMLNTPANELDPGIAAIGFELFFSSDRILPDDPPSFAQSQPGSATMAVEARPAHHYRLYRTTTREVFLEDVAREPFDWAGLMSALWPNLLWMLLGLLALLLLLLLFRDMRDRRLSLLARCLLASLLLHCLLLTAFGFWRISTAVADFMRGRSRVQIVMADTSVSAPLVAQIRGNLTETPAVVPLATPTPVIEPAPPTVTPPQVELAAQDSPRNVRMEPEARVEPRESNVHDVALPDVCPFEVVRTETADVALPRDAARPEAVAEPAMTVATPEHVEVAQRPIDAAPSPATANVTLEPVARSETPTVESRLSTPVESTAKARPDLVVPTPPLPVPGERVSDLTLALPAESAAKSPTSQAVERDASSLAAIATPNDLPREHVPDAAASQPTFAMKLEEKEREDSVQKVSAVKLDARDASREIHTSLPNIASAATATMPDLADVAVPAEPAPKPSPRERSSRTEQSPQVEPITAVDSAPPRAPRGESIPQPAKRVELAPAAVSQATPDGGPQFAADANIEIRDVARVSESRRVEPLPASTAAPALALDLSLPSETELPRRSELRSPPIGALRGVIRDEATREPIGGATVRVDLAGGDPVLVKADEKGKYMLMLPQVPENFAMTAAADGFIPDSRNVAAADIRGKSMQVDFTLKPENETVVAVEDEPEVHHLGNDRFEGAINSQFQRESEGSALIGEFTLSAAQAPPNLVRARITVMVKGVQCPHKVYVNDQLLKDRLDKSPEDGSFGERSIGVPAELLHEGLNTLEIRGVSCRGDLDDFEFVNVQIHLIRASEP